MLDEITTVLGGFPKYPPHTIQRLAELVLAPRQHYRSLAAYLHAVERVVHVTSGSNIYPLPPAIPDMSAMTLLSNGVSDPNGGPCSSKDPAQSVSWSNPATTAASTLGTDEALGGALLTPIPWLTRRPSPGEQLSPTGSTHAEVRTESTETIDGPNGMGSIETVSISINGIPSTGSGIIIGGGSSQRGVTQGELLRQEQRAGVVPVSQLARQAAESQRSAAAAAAASAAPETESTEDEEEEEEVPHARGPEEIGVDDLGPQGDGAPASYVTGTSSTVAADQESVMQDIDVEAAVGRKAEPTEREEEQAAEKSDDETSETGSKRAANEELEDGLASKKVKDENEEVGTKDGSEDAAEKVDEEDTESPDAAGSAAAGS
jgi:hypothetical protein